MGKNGAQHKLDSLRLFELWANQFSRSMDVYYKVIGKGKCPLSIHGRPNGAIMITPFRATQNLHCDPSWRCGLFIEGGKICKPNKADLVIEPSAMKNFIR
jgi:hypothetical protein